MTARDRILQDIREALRHQVDWHDDPGPTWPASGPKDKRPPAEEFRQKFEAVGGVWERAKGSRGTSDAIRRILRELKSQRVWVTRDSAGLLDRLKIEDSLREDGYKVFRSPSREELAAIDISVTVADLAVAETGSVGIIARPGQGRMPGVVAPANVVVLEPENIVFGLEEWLQRIKPLLAGGLCSAAVLTTGPSRTGDIEGILTIGVHGPGRLYVVMMTD